MKLSIRRFSILCFAASGGLSFAAWLQGASPWALASAFNAASLVAVYIMFTDEEQK